MQPHIRIEHLGERIQCVTCKKLFRYMKNYKPHVQKSDTCIMPAVISKVIVDASNNVIVDSNSLAASYQFAPPVINIQYVIPTQEGDNNSAPTSNHNLNETFIVTSPTVFNRSSDMPEINNESQPISFEPTNTPVAPRSILANLVHDLSLNTESPTIDTGNLESSTIDTGNLESRNLESSTINTGNIESQPGNPKSDLSLLLDELSEPINAANPQFQSEVPGSVSNQFYTDTVNVPQSYFSQLKDELLKPSSHQSSLNLSGFDLDMLDSPNPKPPNTGNCSTPSADECPSFASSIPNLSPIPEPTLTEVNVPAEEEEPSASNQLNPDAIGPFHPRFKDARRTELRAIALANLRNNLKKVQAVKRQLNF